MSERIFALSIRIIRWFGRSRFPSRHLGPRMGFMDGAFTAFLSIAGLGVFGLGDQDLESILRDCR